MNVVSNKESLHQFMVLIVNAKIQLARLRLQFYLPIACLP